MVFAVAELLNNRQIRLVIHSPHAGRSDQLPWQVPTDIEACHQSGLSK